MKAKELRELDRDGLTNKIEELEELHLKFRFQKVTGQLENPSKLRTTRRDIARAKTILKEKGFD
ncbi:MAG: 50S ribosomal protein L29 [Chitinispirillales bacterium]|jgi:large subunit ribosomal protein L29|nr:50S ribosomal protein L29 [Chitinispirillales bacterium]